MDEKQKILEAITPVAVLKAMTPEAKRAVPHASLVEGVIGIRKFPFRIGRESRVKKINGKMERIERAKLDDREPSNDLYLIDDGHLLNISREHLQLEKNGSEYLLIDRGSACGTRVGDVVVGGHDDIGRLILTDGDIIAIGSKSTPYLFQFISLDEFEIMRREKS
jgi:pSer/pThr/pTyr-binding forkhead associated (FHA) protein